ENLSQVLQEKGFDVSEVEFRWISSNTVEVSDPEQARSLLKLMDVLEDLDDVQNVTANFDIANQLWNTLAS
ncbi:MAG: YebC/PmpR family DNA-binding transcriptional regulator, partial [Trichodesmium sp. St19_bin1]|nr:YebC/PmpR family DNA-binding transcriptional regulator [Trichodesmium sp. St7_bin2_1]MDE5119724.1 YebC/PmpR family DNA-binding transcriptional regulator [Trichodesmium sp. St19_bin1]